MKQIGVITDEISPVDTLGAMEAAAHMGIKGDLPNGMADMARYIEKDIPPMAGAEDGLAAVRFLSEIYEAARKGSRVQCG